MLHSIQACRGIAALFVLLYHLNNIVFGTARYFAGKPFGTLFDMGHVGVDFFFTLSGFIIMYVHYGDIGRPAAAARYVKRRLERIYPVYWIVLAVMLAAFAAVPSMGLGNELSPLTVLSSAALVYTDGSMVLAPAWTLCHEVLFYALFLGLIVRPRIFGPALAVWAVAIVMADPLRPSLSPALHFLVSPFNLLFLFGMASALIVRKRPSHAIAIAALGTVLFLTSGLVEPYSGRPYDAELPWRLLNGFGSAAIIIGLATAESAEGLRVPTLLVFLGEASYSVYLTHYPVLIGLGKIATRISVPEWALFIAIGAATLIAGVVFHIIVERPLLRWLRSRPLWRAPGVQG